MDANAIVLLVVVVIVALVAVVFARNRAPKSYPVIHEKVTDGVNVEKCSNCGSVLSQQVNLQTAFGGSMHAGSRSKLKINGREVCPKCGVRLQR